MNELRGAPTPEEQAVAEGLALVRLHRQVEMLMQARMAGSGLTATQLDILERLNVIADGLSPTVLSDELVLSRSAMTGALDALERRGYARRTRHPTDRRRLGISLTPTGRELIERGLPERMRALHRVVGVLSPDERRTVIGAYRKVLNALAEQT